MILSFNQFATSWRCSDLSPISRLTHINNKTIVKGSAVDIAPACSASIASVPPIHNKTAAITPSITA